MKHVDKQHRCAKQARIRVGKTRHNATKMDIRVDRVDCVSWKHPNHCLLFLSMSLSTCFMRLLPRAESATFWLATLWPDVANKTNGGISHPWVNEGTFIREYSTIRPILHISFQSFQCPFGNWPDFLLLSYKSPFVNSWVRNLCSPNEDVGRMNKRWNPDFRLTFQWLVTQIEDSRPWKVLRTSGFPFVHPSKIFVWDG